MDRFVLLALVAIPVLIVAHVAMFWRPIGADSVIFWTASHDEGHVQLQGHWQSPERVLPVQFVVVRTAERGS
jgi:hypothetical protein